jgi:hypothetical protein
MITITFGDNNCYCSVNILVEKKLENIIIKYDYTYGTDKDSIKKNPFFSDKMFNKSSKGITLPINELTKLQIKYLLMNDDELSPHIGNTDPKHYKNMIMFQLSLFDIISYCTEKTTKDYFCKTKIVVNEQIYDRDQEGDKLGDTYYYIDYSYTYGLNIKSKELNPFYNYFKDHKDGEIIIKNSLSEMLINHLRTDNETFSKNFPNIDPEYYKRLIMYQLALIWD